MHVPDLICNPPGLGLPADEEEASVKIETRWQPDAGQSAAWQGAGVLGP